MHEPRAAVAVLGLGPVPDQRRARGRKPARPPRRPATRPRSAAARPPTRRTARARRGRPRWRGGPGEAIRSRNRCVTDGRRGTPRRTAELRVAPRRGDAIARRARRPAPAVRRSCSRGGSGFHSSTYGAPSYIPVSRCRYRTVSTRSPAGTGRTRPRRRRCCGPGRLGTARGAAGRAGGVRTPRVQPGGSVGRQAAGSRASAGAPRRGDPARRHRAPRRPPARGSSRRPATRTSSAGIQPSADHGQPAVDVGRRTCRRAPGADRAVERERAIPRGADGSQTASGVHVAVDEQRCSAPLHRRACGAASRRRGRSSRPRPRTRPPRPSSRRR